MTNDRRSEGDPQRAAKSYEDQGRSLPGVARYYVRETIVERCRWGAAAVGEH